MLGEIVDPAIVGDITAGRMTIRQRRGLAAASQMLHTTSYQTVPAPGEYKFAVNQRLHAAGKRRGLL